MIDGFEDQGLFPLIFKNHLYMYSHVSEKLRD